MFNCRWPCSLTSGWHTDVLSVCAQEIRKKNVGSTANSNTIMMYMIIPTLPIRKLRLGSAQGPAHLHLNKWQC